MKRYACEIVLSLLCLALIGCSTVVGSRTTTANGVTTTLSINAKSVMTSVDGLQFSTTDANGFTTSLQMQKAGVDNQALTTVTGGMLEVLKIAATFAAHAPTNGAPPLANTITNAP